MTFVLQLLLEVCLNLECLFLMLDQLSLQIQLSLLKLYFQGSLFLISFILLILNRMHQLYPSFLFSLIQTKSIFKKHRWHVFFFVCNFYFEGINNQSHSLLVSLPSTLFLTLQLDCH